MQWSRDELRKIAESDDLPVAPFRDGGITYGTPTWIGPLRYNGLYHFGNERADLKPMIRERARAAKVGITLRASSAI